MALVTTESTGFVLAGRYRLERRIGGTKTRVWAARDQLLLRRVAVKILDGPLPPQFVAATQALAKLAHPHIVIVNDVGTTGTALYVVMEMLDGPDLAERLRNGPVPWREAARTCADVAAALDAAHDGGIFHGDLRPENIITTEDRVKVCGFGSADQDGLDRYTPPEGAPGLAGDVFALGMILSEALMGRVGVDVALPADVPDDIARLCVRAIADDPASRPTAREFANDLTAATLAPPSAGAGTLIFEMPPPRPRRRPRLLAGAAAAVLAAAAAGIMALVPAGSGPGRLKMPSMNNMLPVAPPPAASPSVRRVRPRRTPVTPPSGLGPAAQLTRLQRAVDAGTAAHQIRDDVGLDLTNQVVAMRRTRAADLPAKAAAFRDKVATRLRERALTRQEAVLLDSIAAGLG